jgi:hypothetical protein
LGGIAEKYGVTRFVKLSHKVTSCIWDDAAKKWYEDDGCPTLPFSQRSDYVIGGLTLRILRRERLPMTMRMFWSRPEGI